MNLTRKQRLILFAAFALALGVSIAHEWSLPVFCLRTPAASLSQR